MQLITALRAEMLKSKKTASFYLTLICTLLIPAFLLLNLLSNGSDLQAVRQDPLNGILAMGAERTGLVFFPLFIILVCTLLPQIEYRNNTWKQVLAAPQTKANIFLAKFISINGFIVIFLLAHLFFMALVIVITHFYYPSMNVLHQPFNARAVVLRTANAYVSMLAMGSFQFWLGLRFRNFIIPIAVGLLLWITGMVLIFESQSSVLNYFPYGFQVFPYAAQLQPQMGQVVWTSIAYTTLFLLFAFLDFRKRRLGA